MSHGILIGAQMEKIRELEAALAAEREQHLAANAIGKDLQVALAAERENAFKLAANQCDGPKIGDEYGHSYCPLVAAERERAERAEGLRSLYSQRAVFFEDRADALEAQVERFRDLLEDVQNYGSVSPALYKQITAALSASSGKPELPSGECLGG